MLIIAKKGIKQLKNIDETLKEASKCLNCKNPSCKKGCPIETNIPEFILEIKNRNFSKAYEILQENNLMSDICSIICPAEEQCTGNCIKGIKDKPIPINKLEKFINEWAKENNIQYDIKINNNINRKIAVIGAGPAGIACSIALRKAGADVTIFEKEENRFYTCRSVNHVGNNWSCCSNDNSNTNCKYK